MTKCVLIDQLEIPHNLFGPSVQIGQLFGIFLKKKTLITCPLCILLNLDFVDIAKPKVDFCLDWKEQQFAQCTTWTFWRGHTPSRTSTYIRPAMSYLY
jgi:hypothetical protein